MARNWSGGVFAEVPDDGEIAVGTRSPGWNRGACYSDFRNSTRSAFC